MKFKDVAFVLILVNHKNSPHYVYTQMFLPRAFNHLQYERAKVANYMGIILA